MTKIKYLIAQLLMVSVFGLILGAPAFAKPADQSKGVEMKNAHANEQAKKNANSNAGFDNTVDTDPVEEPPVEVCAEGTTGIFPDCVEEPTDEPVCPPGTEGTFPFCSQI